MNRPVNAPIARATGLDAPSGTGRQALAQPAASDGAGLRRQA